MPQFAPGELKTARAPITVKPSGLSCSAELYLVSNGAKAATSGIKPFTSTGVKQDVSFPITMPGAEGSYPVYLDIFTNGLLIGAYKAVEDVVIAVPALPQFYMPPVIDFWIDHVEIVGYYYHRITYAAVIINNGGSPGTYTISWSVSWNGNEFGKGSKTITLNPGDSYEHRRTVDIDFHRCHSATFKLYGNWQENNYSEGYLVEGDVVIGNLIEEKHSEW